MRYFGVFSEGSETDLGQGGGEGGADVEEETGRGGEGVEVGCAVGGEDCLGVGGGEEEA